MIFPTDSGQVLMGRKGRRTIFARFGVAPYRISPSQPQPQPNPAPAHHAASSVLIPSVHFHVYLYLCVTQRNYTTFLLRHFSFAHSTIGFTSLLHFCGHPASAWQAAATPKRSETETEPEKSVTETLTGTCATQSQSGIISSLRAKAFMKKSPNQPIPVPCSPSLLVPVCQLSVACFLFSLSLSLASTFMRRRKMIRKRFVINFNNRKYRFLPGPRAAARALARYAVAQSALGRYTLHKFLTIPFFYSFHVVRLR